MARRMHHEQFSFRSAEARQRQRLTNVQPYRRRLRIAPLKDRRPLAVVTVNTLSDVSSAHFGFDDAIQFLAPFAIYCRGQSARSGVSPPGDY
jgi:hypothetical protein